jgi:hypothetical protein
MRHLHWIVTGLLLSTGAAVTGCKQAAKDDEQGSAGAAGAAGSGGENGVGGTSAGAGGGGASGASAGGAATGGSAGSVSTAGGGGAAAGGGGGASVGGGGASVGGGGASVGGGGSASAGAGGTTASPESIACPVEKPQKIYGTVDGATVVLEQDEVWTPDNVYLVFGHFHSGPHSITIQPGTVVCFDYSPPAEASANPIVGYMDIEEGGTLKIVGTEASHVTFTHKNEGDQFWGGISFSSGSKLADTTMQYLDVVNAGLSAHGPVINTFPDGAQPPLDMQHVAFHSLQRVGIANLTSGFTPQSRVRVESYAKSTAVSDLQEYPVLRLRPEGASTVDEEVFQLGPSVPAPVKYIQLDHAEGALIDNDITLHKLQQGLAYRNVGHMKYSGTTGKPATWTFLPGVVFAVSDAGYIQIGNGGQDDLSNLVAVGTEAEPVIFTSDAGLHGEAPAAGDWSALFFLPGNFDPAVTRFEHVVFEYGGGMDKTTVYNCNDATSGFAEILFSNSVTGEDYEGPSVRNVVFSKSASQAVRARNNGAGTGTLLTDYSDPALGNTFVEIATSPPQFPMTCP